MLINLPADIFPSEITPESVYQDRRHFMQGIVGIALATMDILNTASAADNPSSKPIQFPNLKPSPFNTPEELTPIESVTTYNNFYEFGMSKSDPAHYAHALKTRPWSVMIEGEVAKPGMINIEDILRDFALEERIYRMRCVEGWSMVIPWVGFPLSELIKRFQPTSKAKFVQFMTLHDPEQMRGQKYPVLEWPYTEALRMDEAMHPLTILSVGLYGKVLPNQNGAPLRLVVPWKYGFKSIKSIVKIRFVEQQPITSWEKSDPSEYGFYSNVNPQVDHPRWSQKKERRIGDFLKRETLMFNGYAEQVASLYTRMDLKKYY